MECKDFAYQDCIDCAKHCYDKSEHITTKMITKEKFTLILEAIKETEYKNSKFNKAMEEISSSYFISELAYPATSALLDLLKDIFDDNDDWIGWCIYEKDWFTKDMEARYKDGSEIPLNNISELYDFLIDNMKEN